MPEQMTVELQTATATKIPWHKQKTTWAVFGALVTTAGAYMMGEISLITAIMAGLNEIAILFARQGIEKIKVARGL